MTYIRVDKMLSELGYGTRSELKKSIKLGSVSVNGCIITSSDYKVDTDADTILYHGSPIHYSEYEYYVLNKPAGYLSATFDKHSPTVMELVPSDRAGLSPVGRLDKDTEGMLLITNDGQLSHELLSPTKHVSKVYYAEVSGHLPDDVSDIFHRGIMMDGELTRPADIKLTGTKTNEDGLSVTCTDLTIHEGRFHQVKRMYEAVGCKVEYLKRIAFAGVYLDDIAPKRGSCVRVDRSMFQGGNV